MKIRGRYIGILAVLGLLIALVPLAPAGAAVGDLTIIGGAADEGAFFSDKIGFNVLEIAVEDSDLSPARVGKARYDDFNAGATVDLNDGVVAGELDIAEKLDGGLMNPVCVDLEPQGNLDGVPDSPYRVDVDRDGVLDTAPTTADETLNVDACAPQGDVILGPGQDGNYADENAEDDETDTTDETLDNTYTVSLKETLRDADDDGMLMEADDVTVTLDNDGLTAVTEFNFGDAATDEGLGISTIELIDKPRDPNANSDEDENLVIEYKYSEYKFDATTPIRIAGTQVSSGDSFATATNEKQIDGVNSADAIVTTTSSVAGGDNFVIATFVYNVQDKESKFVTVSSSTSQARNLNRVLDGNESSARSNLFESSVLLVTHDDFTAIDSIADDTTYAGDSETVLVSHLTASNLDDDQDLADRIADAVGELDRIETTSKATDLVARLLAVSHGDTISVTYRDASGSGSGSNVVKTAEVDLEAPVVSLIAPTSGSFTSERVVTMEAEVVDEGAGINRDTLRVIASSGVNIEDSEPRSITDGVRLVRVPTTALVEGKKQWAVIVEDRVGNTPDTNDPDTEDENEAALGAAGPGTTIDDVGKAFSFAVDTTAPTLVSGKTGVSLDNSGVTSGDADDQEMEKTTPNREWLRVIFAAGAGTAPLDAATVAPGDFRVDGEEPTEAIVNSKTQGEVGKGLAVYLRVAELDTDAMPKVEITGEIRDRAGNIRSGGSLPSIIDGLPPMLEVTPSGDLADDEIVLAITSTERIRGNPAVTVTGTKPVKDGTVVGVQEPRANRDSGSFTSWTATVENPSAQNPNRYYVVVSASDGDGNEVILGDASDKDDLISFQFDAGEPGLRFVNGAGAEGKLLTDTTSKPEEGAVWIVAEFDEDEHENDKYRDVTVTELKLTNVDTDEVITEDVASLFGGLDACENQGTAISDEDYAKAHRCSEHTLAVNLTPGMYKIEMTGEDAEGNSTTKNATFEVTEAEPFELVLRPGQNFISIPGMPMGDAGNINTLLADEAITAISTYDQSRGLQGESPWLRSAKDLETGMFSGDITAIEPGKAYFIVSKANVTLEIVIQAAEGLPPVIPVRQGYNAIGFWSVSGEESAKLDLYLGGIGWTVAYTYDPTPGVYWQTLRKGEEDFETGELVNEAKAGVGYLVYALYDSSLTP